MMFNYSTVMTWMKYLQFGYWRLNSPKQYDEEEIIQKFNELFNNELAREGLTNSGINPYKGIGFMCISYNEKEGYFLVDDKYGYMTCCYLGIFEILNGKKLALNIKAHGFHSNYFKFVEKEDDDYVFISSIMNCKSSRNLNVIRMVNALYTRQQPIYEKFDRQKIAFLDYGKAEREEILKECEKY